MSPGHGIMAKNPGVLPALSFPVLNAPLSCARMVGAAVSSKRPGTATCARKMICADSLIWIVVSSDRPNQIYGATHEITDTVEIPVSLTCCILALISNDLSALINSLFGFVLFVGLRGNDCAKTKIARRQER